LPNTFQYLVMVDFKFNAYMRAALDTLNRPLNVRLFLVFAFPLGALILFLNYVKTNFQRLDKSMVSVTIVTRDSLAGLSPIAYVVDSTSTRINFGNPFLFRSVDAGKRVWVADLGRPQKARQLRIYFPGQVKDLVIEQVTLSPGNPPLDKHIRCSDDLGCEWNDVLTLNASSPNQYFETIWFMYSSDTILLYPVWVIIALIVVAISVVIYKSKTLFDRYPISVPDATVLLFIFCIFMEQRYFNFALLLSSLFILPRFRLTNLKRLMENKMNLLFAAFFMVILFNALFISPHFKSSALEKYMLFLYLPIYLSCTNNANVVKYFPVSALVMGLFLVLTSLIDVAIFRNPEIAAFINFARIIDPIYYSYLLSFSFFYIELKVTHWRKYFAEAGIIVLLILCSSKLIISFTLVAFVFLFVRSKVALFMVLLVISLLAFFKPVRERFQSIMNVPALSIISEDHIASDDDPRINGFTFRVLAWQESLRSIRTSSDLLWGLGIDDTLEDKLKENWIRRGLVGHSSFNSHDQYVSTLCKTGLLGLLALLSIIGYGLRWGWQTKNTLLMVTLLLLVFAMISESVFDRQNGVSFFCIAILAVGNAYSIKQEQVAGKAANR
jgi:hypothetical protein